MVHKDRLEAIFHTTDADGNGVLTENDFTIRGALLAKASKLHEGTPEFNGVVASFEHLWKGVSAADANHDGKVTKEEFVSFWEKILATSKSFEDLPAYNKKIVDLLFQGLDTNSNGFISKEEYAAGIKAVGGNEHDIDAGYEYLSHIGGGKINVEAYYKAYYHALTDADEKAWKALPQFHATPKH